MGEYLSLLEKTKEQLYGGRTADARETLRKLLNLLNDEYNASQGAHRAKCRGAIVRLLPALEDLKKGNVTQIVVQALGLDETRLPASCPELSPEEEEKESEEKADSKEAEEKWAPAASFEKEKKLNPLSFAGYIGQERAKKSLSISIAAAKKTGKPLAHLMLCASYGIGKTTLANIIAAEMGVPFFSVNATNLKDVKALSLYFAGLERSGIVFIDEIHALKKEVQTVLLSIMTDFSVNLIDEEGKEQRFEVPPFTLIGATTQAGELLKPFLNRFTVIELEDYTEEEILALVKSKFAQLGFEATEEAVSEIARRCRGIPRTAENYVKGTVDIAITHDSKQVTAEDTDIYFELHDIDDLGLTAGDRKLLRILAEAERPYALVTLAAKSGIQEEEIEFRYEPYLLKTGLIEKTERGRVLTEKGRAYLQNA